MAHRGIEPQLQFSPGAPWWFNPNIQTSSHSHQTLETHQCHCALQLAGVGYQRQRACRRIYKKMSSVWLLSTRKWAENWVTTLLEFASSQSRVKHSNDSFTVPRQNGPGLVRSQRTLKCVRRWKGANGIGRRRRKGRHRQGEVSWFSHFKPKMSPMLRCSV